MDILEKYNLNFAKIAKLGGLLILGLIIVAIALSLFGSIFRGLSYGLGTKSREMAATSGNYAYDGMAQKGMMSPELSVRNVAGEDYVSGSDAEQFEVTEYSARIETRKLDETCDLIMALKAKDYIIFENSNKGDTNCNYRFKAKRENAEEVLTLLRSLDPRDLDEKIETIKKQIEDYTSREDILKKKLASIEETLSSAMIAYEEISKLASQTRDASSLASVIKSKIEIIEKLTQEKLKISSELESISRAKAESLDRLEYTYFSVNIYENKYIDIDFIKDSWKDSIRSFVFDMNKVAQDLSIGLVRLIVYVFQFLLYLFIVVLTAKYVWKLFKRIWSK